jgi:iron complex outermembrane recepter protein
MKTARSPAQRTLQFDLHNNYIQGGSSMLKILYLFLVVALLTLPSYGSANENEEGKKVSPPERAASSGGAEKKASSYALGEIVVSATKTNVPAEYAPFTTYSVDRKNIESQPDYYRSNYGQLIQDLPGVFVGQAPNKNGAWVNLRGTGDFSARTLYLVDGMPLGSSIMFTNTISNNDIERIDVVMGPSSALYGSNASGGVVNIITRQGAKGMGSTASFGYGSFNTSRPHASIGNEVKSGDNSFNYYFSYSGDYSNGYANIPIDNTLKIYKKSPSTLTTATFNAAGYSSNYLAGKVGWKGSNGASLTLGYNWASLNIDGGQPNLYPVDNGKQGLGNLNFQLPIADIAKVTLTGGHQFWDRPAKTDYGISLDKKNDLVFNWNRRYSQQSKVQRLPAELQSDFYLGKNNVLTAGAFYSNERISSETDGWVNNVFTSRTSYKTDQKAFYIQDQAFFLNRKLSLLGGLRYDDWKYYEIFDSASKPANREDYRNSTVTYRGGAKYQINDELAIRSSAGTAYYPGIATWYFQNVTTGTTWRVANPNLKPEETWMVDLGLEGQYKKSGTSFSATAYYGKITNMFSGRYDPHPTIKGVSILTYQNVGKAEIYGLEARLEQRLVEHLSATLNLTLNESRIIEDPANQGRQVANSPNFMGNVGLKYANPGLINGTLIYRWVANQFYDNENTGLPYYHMNPYQTVDLKIWRDWKLTDKTTLKTALTVENVLDRQFAQEYVYANPGRTVMGVMGVNF